MATPPTDAQYESYEHTVTINASNVHYFTVSFQTDATYLYAMLDQIMSAGMQADNSIETSLDPNGGYAVEFGAKGTNSYTFTVTAKPLLYPAGTLAMSESFTIIIQADAEPYDFSIAFYDSSGAVVP